MVGIQPELVEDIILVGSNMGYDYQAGSDLDIHIQLDKDKIGCDEEFVDQYFRLTKKDFDANHDIRFYNIPVEVYVEDVDDPYPKGAGRYSLFEDEWESEPTKDLPDPNSREIRMKVRTLTNEVQDLIDDRVDVSVMKKVRDKIRESRSNGLNSYGLSSQANVMFKELRNNGIIKKMKDYIVFRTDRELSLF